MLGTSTVMNRARAARIPVAVALALVLLLAPFAGFTTAKADGGLNLSTPYPGVSVNPGEDVTFDMTVENETASPQNVQLSAETPEGWSAYYEGDGNPVSRVYVDDADSDANTVSVSLVVKIPDDVTEGTFSIKAKAVGENGAEDTIQLDVTIATEEYTQGKLTAQYQEQEGSSSTTFMYSMALVNGSNKAQSYSLSAVLPSDGWQVKFMNADGLQIASLNLEGGRSQTITVSVDPPTDVDAGSYIIPVTATSASEELSVKFTAVITGTYAMTMATANDLLSVNAVAGDPSTVTLIITNTGTADLNGISLVTSSVPTNWTVTFDTDKIDTLAAGQNVQVVVTIQPASDAINGDYEVDIKAKTDQATSAAAFRVTVETSTIWGIVGIAIVAVVVIALVLIFRKFGRR